MVRRTAPPRGGRAATTATAPAAKRLAAAMAGAAAVAAVAALPCAAAGAQVIEVQVEGLPMPRPPVVASADGLLDTSLRMGPVNLVGAGLDVWTRAWNGSVPGPMLRVRGGDRLRVRLHNDLEMPLGPSATNKYHHPNSTNLHLHGMHIDPNAPGDDVLDIHLLPGESYQYEYLLISDHSPGIYWAHPHHHGSQVAQTGAGAASALVVQDPPGFLSSQLAAMRDHVLVLQDLPRPLLEKAALVAQDELFRARRWDADEDLWLVNGAPRPTLEVPADRWQRVRLVQAGVSTWLSLGFGRCEAHLLAKDGIYVDDFPRRIDRASLPPGGRCEVVVRCPPGLHEVVSAPPDAAAPAARSRALPADVAAQKPMRLAVAAGGEPLVLFTVRAEAAAPGKRVGETAEPLEAWSPPSRPGYLRDLRSGGGSGGSIAAAALMGVDEPAAVAAAPAGGGRRLRSAADPDAVASLAAAAADAAAAPACSCNTSLGLGGNNRWISGHLFQGDGMYANKWLQGAVAERNLSGVAAHPFHQHTWPFQLQQEPMGGDAYFRAGDWHDTYMNARDPEAAVRFRTVDYSGPLVVHCHALAHSDTGMIAVEWVGGSGPEACQCGALGPPAPAETPGDAQEDKRR